MMRRILSVSLGFAFTFLGNSLAVGQWVQTGGPSTSFIQALLSTGDALYAGAGTQGVFRTTNRGSQWLGASSGLANTDVLTLVAIGTDLYAGTNGGVFRSTNSGGVWEGANGDSIDPHVRAIAFTTFGGGSANFTLFAGTLGGGIFRTTNSGSKWTAVNVGLTERIIYSLIADSNESGGFNLFAGARWGVFLSTNNGEEWIPRNSGLPYSAVVALTVMSTPVAKYLLAATTGHGVYRSTDIGTTWYQRNVGLPDVDTRYLLVVDQRLFLCVWGRGVFVSTNVGDTWNDVNSGLVSPFVLTLATDSEQVFVGTAYDGVSRRPLLEMTAVERQLSSFGPEEFILDQNYPNPFNATTQITYAIAENRENGVGSADVRLVVYDFLGREVAILVDGVRAHGKHTVTWDASEYASGAYFYLLEGGRSSRTRKLVLMK